MRSCVAAVACKSVAVNTWGSWQGWSPCTRSCNRGIQIRRRTCTGGDDCAGERFDFSLFHAFTTFISFIAPPVAPATLSHVAEAAQIRPIRNGSFGDRGHNAQDPAMEAHEFVEDNVEKMVNQHFAFPAFISSVH